jgi:hypothetical protein
MKRLTNMYFAAPGTRLSFQVLFTLLLVTFFPFNFATSTTGGSNSPFLTPDGVFDLDAVDLFPLSVTLTFFRVLVSSVAGFRALFRLEVHRLGRSEATYHHDRSNITTLHPRKL